MVSPSWRRFRRVASDRSTERWPTSPCANFLVVQERTLDASSRIFLTLMGIQENAWPRRWRDWRQSYKKQPSRVLNVAVLRPFATTDPSRKYGDSKQHFPRKEHVLPAQQESRTDDLDCDFWCRPQHRRSHSRPRHWRHPRGAKNVKQSRGDRLMPYFVFWWIISILLASFFDVRAVLAPRRKW